MLFGTLLVHIWFVLINYEVRTFLGGQWVLRAHLGHVPTLSFIFFFLNSGHALPCGTLIAGYSWLREWDTRKGKKKENEKEMKRSDHLGKLEGIKALRLSITVDRLLLFLFFFSFLFFETESLLTYCQLCGCEQVVSFYFCIITVKSLVVI